MMIVENKFDLGETVYLRTDREQLKRIVTAIKVCPDNCYLYELICGTMQSYHYDIEISKEEDTVAKIVN